tara:strand:+ start:229 stop:759 length:531 start_codon:yes stop_codon:yes gene_type:complete
MTEIEKKAARVAQWRPFVAKCLGREPRGFRDVVAFNTRGEPSVIQVCSVVDGKPFPTLYWLIDAALSLDIDRLEAAGWIAKLQNEIADSSAFQRRMHHDHRAHIALRDSLLSDDDRRLLAANGMASALSDRGIGGISEPDRVRCFHTWYAAHLVVPNSVGTVIDRLLSGAIEAPLI